MRGDENRVIDAYATWLERSNWKVRRDVNFIEVYAERGDERLYAEAKGRTTSPGLGADTLYGQLLRRMKDPEPGARYSVAVPASALNAALCVPGWVRDRLTIEFTSTPVDVNRRKRDNRVGLRWPADRSPLLLPRLASGYMD